MRKRFLHGAVLLLATAAGGEGVPARADQAAPAAQAASPEALSALLDRALSPSERAERAYLESLGWRFVTDPQVKEITVSGGTPCRRANLAEAQSAGDLRILVPPNATAEDVSKFAAASFSRVLEGVPSRCAWQFLTAPAVERATDRLAANAARGAWVFPQWLVVNAAIFSMDPPRSSWVRRDKVCYAKDKPSAAVTSFYSEKASTECYVAQTLAAYAIQYELYGAEWFDQVFAPDEIAIGQVGPFHETAIGKTMQAPQGYPWRGLFLQPQDAGTDPGVVLGRLGPLAFPGLTGILMDQHGSGRSNQNFTFVSVTPAAAQALVENGGFPYVGRLVHEFRELEKSKRGKFVVGADLTRWRTRIDRILADPVLTGIRIYVHPYPVMTLGKMVDRLTRMDRTAVHLVFYDEAREDFYFLRYRKAWIARWKAAAPGR
jgi:hypothetical protein